MEGNIIPRIINNDPKLTDLTTDMCYLSVATTTRLIDALKHNTTITSVDFSDSQLGDSWVAQLSQVLKMNNAVVSLTLWNNKITRVGAMYLAQALEINSTLTSLDLRGNAIEGGMIRLNNAFRLNQTLTRLDYDAEAGYKEYCWPTVQKNKSLFDLLYEDINEHFWK